MTIIPIIALAIGYLLFLADSGFYGLAGRMGRIVLYFFLTETFVYAVSVLAAMIAGTTITHFLLSIFMNGMLPGTVYMVNQYLTAFLYGLTEPPIGSTWFSPLTMLFRNYGFERNLPIISFSAEREVYPVLVDQRFAFLVFAAAALLLVLIAYQIYKRLPLEREGESVTFKWPGEVVSYLFAFMGMTFVAFQLRDFHTMKTAPFIITAFIGSLVFFAAARMILAKSVRIFHRNFWLKYGAFLLGAAVFLSFTMLDVTGFERFVPEPENVASIALDDDFGCDMDYMDYHDDAERIHDAESIARITQFHQTAASYAHKEQTGELRHQKWNSFYIAYRMKDGSRHVRSYHISVLENRDVYDAYEKVAESSGYREYNHMLTIPPLDNVYFELSPSAHGHVEVSLPPKAVKELQTALEADRKAYTLKDIMEYSRPWHERTFELTCDYTLPGGRKSLENPLKITEKDVRTQTVLFDHGYGKFMTSDFAE